MADIPGLLGRLAQLPSVVTQGLLGPLPQTSLGLDPKQMEQARQSALTDMAYGMLAGSTAPGWRNQMGTVAVARQNAIGNYRGRIFDMVKENEYTRLEDERKKRQAGIDAVLNAAGQEDPLLGQLAAASPQQFVDQAIQSRFAKQAPGDKWRVLTPEEAAQAGLPTDSDWQVNEANGKIDKLYSPPTPAQTTFVMPGENKFAEVMAADSVARLNAADTQARAGVGTITAIRTASRALDKAVVGTGAELRTSFGKLLNTLGMSNGEGVAATSAFLNSTGQLAAEMLASKVFGSGTGISQKDLEFAIGLVGNDQSLTKPQIQRILAIREKMARAQIIRYNELRNNLAKQPAYAPYIGPYSEMGMPDPIQWVAPGTKVAD